MSNKILALIILVLIFGTIIWGYLYLFVFYGGNLQVQWNVEDYTVTLSTDTVWQELTYNCLGATCSYENIPPLEYTVRISKDGFQEFKSFQKIPGKGTVLLEFLLEKKTELTQLWETKIQDVDIITSQKVTRLKYRNFYSYYDFSEKWVFYIREYLWKLFLYHDIWEEERLVFDFKKVSPDKIHISPIYGTDFFNVYIDQNNYLFDNKTTWFRSLDLKKKIEYWKVARTSQDIIFVTDIWSYIYNLKERRSEYYIPFLDFVYVDDKDVIWLIEWDDEKRMNNLWVNTEKQRALFRYNTLTKSIKKIYETNEGIESFYLEKSRLYLDVNGVKKELQNY